MPYIKLYDITMDATYQKEVVPEIALLAAQSGVDVSEEPFPEMQFRKEDGSLKPNGTLEGDWNGHPGHGPASMVESNP